jgi:Subtilase family
MTNKPLLIFPNFTSVNPITKPSYGSEQLHFPHIGEQKERVTPQFDSVLQKFITDTTVGIEPEYVLVLETIGKVEDFAQAVRAVDGLEWLAEIDDNQFQPADGFFNIPKIGKTLFSKNIDSIDNKQSGEIWEALMLNGFVEKDGHLKERPIQEFKKTIPAKFIDYADDIHDALVKHIKAEKKKAVSGRFFLAMSNRRAMQELESLWKQWSKDPAKQLAHGYGKWKDIFQHLHQIRPWDVSDRMKDTGILESWKEDLIMKIGTASMIPFEIELWYRKESRIRKRVQTDLERLVREENGKVIASIDMPEIFFHAIKAELPSEKIDKVINEKYSKLFTSNDVMFFRPRGQSNIQAFPDGDLANFERGTVSGEPIVALLDGYPFTNHDLLADRIIIDDPDDFGSKYTNLNERQHCTAMASLICHGELDADEDSLTRPLYIRPIMVPNPNSFSSPRNEHIPDEKFLEDLIERSVRRIFEGDGKGAPSAPTIKIINLAIGDASRLFLGRLSPTARLLDWLSYKYQVLFCVSAGNITNSIDLGMTEDEFKDLEPENQMRHTMQRIHSDIRNRRMLLPAESINSITVGALHQDYSHINYLGNRIDILPVQSLPSPISAHGHGFRNSIKPDIYLPGGRQLYTHCSGGKYNIADSHFAPGQKVATTPVNPGESGRYVYKRGTSNATALASRFAALIYEILTELNRENEDSIPDERIPVMLKTLLVHGASWAYRDALIEKCFINEMKPRHKQEIIARYLGFGTPSIERVLNCTDQRATALGSGVIKKNQVHEYSLPLPDTLVAYKQFRRLTITLAWFTPINPESRKYRKANLSFSPPQGYLKNFLKIDRVSADWRQVKNGTVQHEIFEGRKTTKFEEGDSLKIQVACKEDAGAMDEEIRYGLAVTLEVAEDVDIPVYEEIKTKLSVPIQIQEGG